jgi:WD40 repeat protein
MCVVQCTCCILRKFRASALCTVALAGPSNWQASSRNSLRHLTLRCHALSPLQSGVSALRFNRSGALLASGGRDTDVIVWDVVAESGLYRLKGHRDQVRVHCRCSSPTQRTACHHIHRLWMRAGGSVFCPIGAERSAAVFSNAQVTDVVFIERGGGKLVSSSKDGFVRVWELATQHCCQTLVRPRPPPRPHLAAHPHIHTHQTALGGCRTRPNSSPAAARCV